MARQLRPDVPGGWHHITNHALRNEQVFHSDGDRHFFLSLLSDASIRYGTEVAAYCLMGNHYHLVLHCPDGGLSATLQHFASRYVRGLNRRHGFNGPLFKSRFYSKVIADDHQLLATTRYVHRNPLDLRCDIGDYPWSSYPAYLSGESDGLVYPRVPLELAGGPEAYRRLVEANLPGDSYSIDDGVRFIGRLVSPRPSVESIQADVAARVPGSWTDRNHRAVVCLVALNHGYSGEELSGFFGLSPGSFRNLTRRSRGIVDSDPALRTVVSELSGPTTARRAA